LPEADFAAAWSAFALPPQRVSDNAPTSLSLAHRRVSRCGCRRSSRQRQARNRPRRTPCRRVIGTLVETETITVGEGQKNSLAYTLIE